MALNQGNSQRFGEVRAGGTDMGGAEAYVPYDELTADLFTDINGDLTTAAGKARFTAIVSAAVTGLCLLVAVLLALLIARTMLGPIRRVRDGALHVAKEELPETVARIRAGEAPGEIVPIDVTTEEEMGQLARAFDEMHRQAISLASGEAELRSQVGDMFATLSRRNTTLINQQLGLIEDLERDEEDPRRLESLFRLDHLASRMRRTAESLMVLADAPTPGPTASTSRWATCSRQPSPVCATTSASRSSRRPRAGCPAPRRRTSCTCSPSSSTTRSTTRRPRPRSWSRPSGPPTASRSRSPTPVSACRPAS